jgi:tetratricopeptide (TPR) repeat protein
MQLHWFSKYGQASLLGFALATTFTLFLSLEAKAQSTQALTEIEQLYAAGNYSQAMNLVDAQMKDSIRNSNLHYLRANILAAQGEISPAASEYEQALQLSPSPTVRDYCNKALAAMQRLNSPPSNAVSAIEKQARHEVKQVQRQSTFAGQQMEREAASYQQMHAAKTSQIVNRMSSAGFYDRDGDWLPAYDPADISAVAARRQAKEAQIVNQAQRSSQDVQAAGQERAAAVANSAEGLKSQMDVPARPGEAALNPVGTNLFIRNYSQPESEPKPATVKVP